MSSSTTIPSAIDGFPAELLLKVFHAYVAPRQGVGHYHTIDADTRHRRSVVITHVCHEWKGIALGEPALWTDIRLAGTAKLDLLYFERSRPLPINLTIDLQDMARKPQGVDCAAIIGTRLLARPMEDRTRIRSIRTTHLHDYDARSMISAIGRLKLPALSELFIRTTSIDAPNDRHRRRTALQAQPLMNATLTTLELHNGRQILDGNAVKRALEVCHGLTTLVLGGLLLEERYSPPHTPLIHAPALRRLAVGTPMFETPEDHERCRPRCPCPFRNLIVDNLEYLEIAGGALRETIDHLIPLLKRRVETVDNANNSSSTAPLTVVFNSFMALSPFFLSDNNLIQSLPHNIHLHLFNNGLEYDEELDICDWYKSTQSTVLYVPRELTEGVDVSSEYPGLAPFRCLQPNGSMTSVLIHPAAEDCLDITDRQMNEWGWILPGGEEGEPYLNPEQPNNGEDVRDSFNRPLQDYPSLEIWSNADWLEYRRGLGWPDNYDSGSD